MTHEHIVVDTNPCFEINIVTREIKNMEPSKNVIMQFDHNSERFGFSMPRYIEGHDMSECDKVEVHFINESIDKKTQIKDKYEINDLIVDPDDEEKIKFTWLLSGNTSKLEGSLVFSIRFVCFEEENGEMVDYSWGTAIFPSILVAKGLFNDEYLIDENPDAFKMLEKELQAYIDEQLKESNSDLLKAGSGDNSIIANSVNKNSFAMNEAVGAAASAFGEDNIAGGGIYYVKSIDFNKKKIYLSSYGINPEAVIPFEGFSLPTDNTDTSFEAPLYNNGDEFSLLINVTDATESHYHFCAKIKNVQNNVITYEGTLPFAASDLVDPGEPPVFLVPTKPLIGAMFCGDASFAEGFRNIASGLHSHTEGSLNIAVGYHSHAEGRNTKAGFIAHSEGLTTRALGMYSHAEGHATEALGKYSHSECKDTKAIGYSSHAEGDGSRAEGIASHAEGYGTKAKADYSHTEGMYATVEKNDSYDAICGHAEGYDTKVFGKYAHSEGNASEAHGEASHVEGRNGVARGMYSHVEGYGSSTGGDAEGAHAEGNSQADGKFSHAEGGGCKVLTAYGHAEGYNSKVLATTEAGARVEGGHAEGNGCEVRGNYAHAEGYLCKAYGTYSHAEGAQCKASGPYSHAEGYFTIASGSCQHVSGIYNIEDKANKYLVIVGNGGNASSRANAHTIDFKGNACFSGDVYAKGADMSSGKKVATEEYVKSANLGKNCYVEPDSNGTARGWNTRAEGGQSFAEGYMTTAVGPNQHVMGKLNELSDDHVFIIGCGYEQSIYDEEMNLRDPEVRRNSFTIGYNGDVWARGTVESAGVILKSPNGTRFMLTVQDDGTLTTAKI